MSALTAAVRNKDAKAVKALLDGGANPNDPSFLLARAVELRSKTIVKALLGAGADVNAPNAEGHRPLHLLAQGMRDAAIGALLLDAGAEIDATDDQRFRGYTALHYAMRAKKLDFAQFLFERGADLEVRNVSKGETPLMMLLRTETGVLSATERANALWLIERGADVNTRSDNGCAPLHHAAENATVDMVNLLIERGATASVNKYGGSPLHYTMTTKAKDTALWDRLLALGCSLEQQEQGSTVLATAQTNRNATAVKWCLARGADPNAVDSDGVTPLESARKLGQDEIISLLEAI